MAPANKVLRSFDAPDGRHCVDIFRRPDGSAGFEVYRRDPEDPAHGWFPVGGHGERRFEDPDAALAAACRDVGWLGAKPE